MIKLLVDGQEHKFETTIFPDGTSQVWKLDLGPEEGDEIEILWLFENEAELMHVCQLAQLLQVDFDYSPTLICPYLPYARQDKDIANNVSFALTTFKEILYNCGICRVETFDVHSHNQDLIYSTAPTEFHKSILNHHVICFPDKGAADRYGKSLAFKGLSTVYCQKIRNQQTGEILGLDLIADEDTLVGLNSADILIVDDICDGGMTFIKVAETLNKYAAPRTIDLAVSHGLFSKGKEVLHAAGINRLYTTNSLLRNPEGFKVW